MPAMRFPKLKWLLIGFLALLTWVAITVGTVRAYQAWQLHQVEHQTLREIIRLLNAGQIHVQPAPPATEPKDP